MAKCVKCLREVIPDEMGLTKKLMGRGTEKYFCIDCLANELSSTPERLNELIERFKKEGCALFSQDE